jgi:hypothetical protein
MIGALGNVSPGAFIISVAIAAACSMGVFWHASKNGSRHATAWGIATFLFAGLTLPVYVIHYFVTRRGRY